MLADPIRAIYHAAKQRCTNPKDPRYRDYGGRGIEFRFNSFAEFFADIGPRPVGHTLHRVNNDGHYETGNVRWATPKEQAANRRPRLRRGVKLTTESAEEIRKLHAAGASPMSIRFRFGISATLVWLIVRRKIWR